MRDLVFKNLLSKDRKRRIIASSEVAEHQGVRSVIHRHFICLVREMKEDKDNIKTPAPPEIYILKDRSTRKNEEKFFCRIKGSIYAVNKGKLFLILFVHSLKITLATLPGNPLEL